MAPLTTSTTDLHHIANDLGVTLRHHNGGKKAWYSPKLRTISTRRGLPIWEYKSSLAHELGHAVYRDHHINHLHFNQLQERRADEYAAELLINEDEIKDLILWHGNDLNSLAYDLEVTPHLLDVYLKMNTHLLKEAAA